MPPFQKILVPVDGSSTSAKALDYALQLARDNHSQVRAMHAIDELGYLSGYEYSGQLVDAARKSASEVLHKAVLAAQAAGVALDTHLIDQPGQRLGQTVADEAARWGADLVVTGTHGRRGVGRMLLGSGAEQIVRMAPVAVLTVRAD
ncbi:MAG: universal stress protein [Limnohabitans sp.]|jgi:nucleotide-binding universal stress UspA family protein